MSPRHSPIQVIYSYERRLKPCRSLIRWLAKRHTLTVRTDIVLEAFARTLTLATALVPLIEPVYTCQHKDMAPTVGL